MLSLLELCVHYSNWILSSSYQYDSITQTLASCNVTQDGNYAYIFLKFFFLWILTELHHGCSQKPCIGSGRYAKHCVFKKNNTKTQNKTSYIWITGVGLDTWASRKPGTLLSHVAVILLPSDQPYLCFGTGATAVSCQLLLVSSWPSRYCWLQLFQVFMPD